MSDDQTGRILAIVERLEAGQAKLEAGQAKLEETAIRQGDDLIRLRVDVVARMDRLEDSLTAIRDDISTNYGIADAAHRANDNTRSEMRALGDVVSSLVRQVRRLDTEVRSLKGGDA